MLFDDTYKEIKTESKSVYKEKGSKFISYAYPVYNRAQIEKKLENIRKTEKSANHYCYAYVLHPDKSEYKINDDGEPNSTAGRPILNQIKKYELTNILVVVTRYFGGIKLGIPGLIRAYKTAANDVITNAAVVSKLIKEKYTIMFNHDEIEVVMRVIKEYNLEIINTDFQLNCKLTFLVPKTKSSVVLNKFKRMNLIYQ